jgi:hypothetical protein
MPLPTFLSPAELTELQTRATKARNEINAIVAQLEAAGELDLMPKFRKASGDLYAGINQTLLARQKRVAIEQRRADYVAECVREGSVVPGSKLLEGK